MLYRAIHTIVGEIRAATYVNDDIDLIAERDAYAAQSLLVCPISEAEFPLAQAAVSDDSYYIDYSPIDESPFLVESPPRPSPYYDFDFASHTWVVSAERLAQAKEDKTAELSAEYRTRRNANKLWSGNPYSPTDELIGHLRGVVATLEYFTAPPAGWEGVRSSNGGRTTVYPSWSDERDNIAGMLANFEKYRAECLTVYWAYLDDIAGAATVEDVLALTFTTGWPTP